MAFDFYIFLDWFNMCQVVNNSLRVDLLNPNTLKKCPYSELFSSVFFRIRTEYGEMLRISPYSVRMWESTEQNNSG